MASMASMAAAQDLADDFETPRGIALGTGMRASSASLSALVYNVANLPVGRMYHVGGMGMWAPDSGQYSLTGAVVDSITTSVAAGVAIRGIFNGDDPGYTGFDGKLGLGIPFSDAFGLGISGRYVSMDQKGVPASGVAPPDTRGFTMDAALRAQLGDMVRVAALANNFIDMDSPWLPMTVGGALGFQVQSLSIGGDVLFDLTTVDSAKPLIGGGLEYFTGQAPLRLGYLFDGVRQAHAVSGGVGYMTQVLGLDIGVRQYVSGINDTLIMASIQYFAQ
jgi:hypothetical protein